MTDPPDSLERQVRDAARALGIDAVRFTTPAAPDHGDFVAAWLKAGLHGEMGYLERRADLRSGRLDDDRLLAGAKSVVVVALSYDLPAPPRPPGARGVIARYARGDDYHRVLWDRLDALGAEIARLCPGARSRGFTDSGPIRERELARRAGLGWQGKHTNLISLDLGNFFFLGALLTTAELAPDRPFETRHCGSCVRCIDACPTGAIVSPMVLDARRCVSYLTIELKGPIPEELRAPMGDRIFGCDDCLAVCPWNGRAQEGREARFAARDVARAFPDLGDLLELLGDEAAFRERFAGTPLLRPGRAGLRRNVCVALGNVGGAQHLPALEGVRRTDPSEMVREHAAWAIARIEGRVA